MKSLIFILFMTLLPTVGCSGNVSNTNGLLSGSIQADSIDRVKIMRFDKDFYHLSHDSLQVKYPLLLPALGSVMIGETPVDNPNFFSDLQAFYAHPMLQQIYKDELVLFDNVSSDEATLSRVNAIIRSQLPDKKLPSFAMHVSGFKENVIVLDNMISLSADKYLGINYPAYKQFFEPYELQQMQPKMVVRDYVRAWIMSDVIKNKSNQNLLTAIINEGKILYLLSVLLEDYSAADVIGYTQQQQQWCENNERLIWETALKNNTLFTTDYDKISQYITDAPYTQQFSSSSPGRVGCWLGWQIVAQYMRTTNSSLSDLINRDAAVILKESKYSK